MEPLKDRQGKIIPGAFTCSNVELQSPHYQDLKSPVYRQELWNIYHEVEHEPSNAFLYGEAPTFKARQQASVPERAPTLTNESASMVQVKSLLVDLQNRLNKHIDYKKKSQEKMLGIKE